MKKINLFSMAAAFLLAATGCSDDLEENGNNQGEPIDGNGVYLSVNIMTPSTSGAYTKAGEEGTTSSNPTRRREWRWLPKRVGEREQG